MLSSIYAYACRPTLPLAFVREAFVFLLHLDKLGRGHA